MKTALVVLAEGFEEIEAVTPIDVLRRAGAEVTVAGLTEGPIRGAHGVPFVPDAKLDDVADGDYDAVVLPGGLPGATNLRDSETLKRVLTRQFELAGVVGAICASPAVVLSTHGFLKGRIVTCHPACAEDMVEGNLTADRVVVDGNIVTAKGPGTALEFALALVTQLYGPAKAHEVNAPMFGRV